MIGRASWVALGIVLALMGGEVLAQSAPTGYTADALYNLANSYARAGKPGMAVLNYERARLLAPNDPDIEENLRHVRESQRLTVQPHHWFDRAVDLSPTLVAWLGVVGFIVAGLNWAFGRLYFRRRWSRAMALAVGMALIGLTVANGMALWPRLHEGVVIMAGTSARVSPVPMGDPLFVLPEAETVAMTAEHEGFVLVKTRAGRIGWVSKSNLAPIVPRN